MPEELSDKDIKENKSIAVLSYIGVLCLVPFLTKRKSKFVRFHSKQGIVILIGWVFTWFPFWGWALGVVLLILSIIGISNVLDEKYKKLPVIGDLAEKINI